MNLAEYGIRSEGNYLATGWARLVPQEGIRFRPICGDATEDISYLQIECRPFAPDAFYVEDSPVNLEAIGPIGRGLGCRGNAQAGPDGDRRFPMFKFGHKRHRAVGFEGFSPQNAPQMIGCMLLLRASFHTLLWVEKPCAVQGKDPEHVSGCRYLTAIDGNVDMPCKFDASSRDKR